VSETSSSPVESYSGKKAADVVGISYRQLDYWARTDLIRPSLADAKGSGTRRRYSYRDLIELKLVKTLLDDGIKLESIREAFGYLRDQLGEDLTTTKLVIAGNSAVLVRENDELIDVVNRYQGQGVLNLLSLDGVQSQVDAAIVELRPTEAPSTTSDRDGAVTKRASGDSPR
jgi:DNA-binding transcriptional MerR regulator